MKTLIKDDHLCVDLQLPERDYTGEEIIVIELRIGCIKVRERERERKKKERKRERDTERESPYHVPSPTFSPKHNFLLHVYLPIDLYLMTVPKISPYS